MSKYYGFYAKSEAEVENVAGILASLGFNKREGRWDKKSWPILWVTPEGRVQFAQTCSGIESSLKAEYANVIPDMTHFFRVQLPELLTIRVTDVVLNDNYTARVFRDDRVVVGCTTFTHAAVLAVADAIKAIKR